MIERPAGRALPVLDMPPASARPLGTIAEVAPEVAEFRPESQAMPRFFVWTLGCQMNRSDSEEMAGSLAAAGCEPAPALEAADLIVINTCAVREHAEAKVIGRQGQLTALKESNPSLRVVLTGCAVREAERSGLARRFPAVDLFLRPDEEPELPARLGLLSAQAPVGLGMPTAATTVVSGRPVSAADNLAGSRAAAVGEARVGRSSAFSAWLPIIYGCDKTCTYCIVPFSRGPERSRPFDDVVAEAGALAVAGYREVTLLGQNVNSYGHDLPPEERFGHIDTERWGGRSLDLRARPDLAELLCAIDSLRDDDGAPLIPRLRFITSHPWDLSDRLIDAMATCPSVCEYLHLPIQSGDDEVLRRMGRQYTVEHYLERLARIREAVPGIAVSTDIIVGFCGETESQFLHTLDVLEQVRYDVVYAAAYSPRPGTPALRLSDDVPAAEKRRRLNELLARQSDIGHELNRRWLGQDVEVLVDTITPPRAHAHVDPDDPNPLPARPEPADGDVALAGRTRHNKLVHLTGPADLVGRLVTVHVDHAGPFALRGRLQPAA